MAVNEVIVNGETIVDLKSDTVTPETLAEGVTAHDASGEQITGTGSLGAVRYDKAQGLTEAQKAQARENIGVPEQSEIVQAVLESIGTPIFGVVDSDNNVILTGQLEDGTYSIKYEMENGNTVNIGNLVLDTRTYYSITNNLTDCTNSNSTTKIAQGESYSATITAKSGYELKSVSVTMGGAAVSVSGGVINIASVTGNIVITAAAEEVAKEPTNFADTTSSDWIKNGRIGSDGGIRTDAAATSYATNFISCQQGDIIFIKNGSQDNERHIGFYNSSKTKIQAATWANCISSSYITDASVVEGSNTQLTVNVAGTAFVRFSLEQVSNASNVIINVKRNGEYL